MLIEAKHVAVKYQLPFQHPVDALLDVSLEVEAGKIIGILGRNGAGKTTLLRTLVGLIRPFSGSLRVFQLNPIQDRVKVIYQCGVLLDGQRFLPPRWTPSDLLIFQGTKFGLSTKTIMARSRMLLERFNLYENRLKTIMSLSRGMKQKLALCVSLINDPKLLILDEPTLGLDVEATRELLSEIRAIAEEDNRSVLITSHQLTVIEKIAHRVLVIHDGKDIFFDSPNTLIRTVGRGSVKLTFASMSPDFILSLPKTVKIQNETIITPSDSGSMHQIFSSAHQYGAELVLVEQGLDFENSFLELTKV